jgi:hypothetical protein
MKGCKVKLDKNAVFDESEITLNISDTPLAQQPGLPGISLEKKS